MLNRNYKIFSLLLIFGTSIIYGNAESLKHKSFVNKGFCALAASKPVLGFENKMLAKVYNLIIGRVFGDELASSEYQELGKEAQSVLGIAEQYHVPIKKFPPIMSNFPAAALAMPGAIYINEDRLKSESYGAKRSCLFHEVIHKKYNDVSFNIAIEFGTLIGSGYFSSKLLSYASLSKWVHYPLVAIVSLFCTNCAGIVYSKYMERRADIEGHFATQCSECVQESASRRRRLVEIEKNPLQNNGYLFADALEQIAQKLKSENKLCHYHGGNK